MSEQKATPVAFRFQPATKEALRVIAERESRSMANMVAQHGEHGRVAGSRVLRAGRAGLAPSRSTRKTCQENQVPRLNQGRQQEPWTNLN